MQDQTVQPVLVPKVQVLSVLKIGRRDQLVNADFAVILPALVEPLEANDDEDASLLPIG